MRLEYIVRPFQTADVTPPSIAVDPNAEPQPNLVLKFGEQGAIKQLSGSFNSTISSYTDDNHQEVSRETSVKRITNPDDSSQFVDVEVINKLTVEKGEGKEYKKVIFNFKNHETA